MSGARTSTLANLRGSIERIEAPCDAHALNKVALGHAEADATLQGGLALAAVHEVFAEGRQSAAATGFEESNERYRTGLPFENPGVSSSVTVRLAKSMAVTLGARPESFATWGAFSIVPSGSWMSGL